MRWPCFVSWTGMLLLLGCGREEKPAAPLVVPPVSASPVEVKRANDGEPKKRLVPRATYQGNVPKKGRAELILLVSMN